MGRGNVFYSKKLSSGYRKIAFLALVRWGSPLLKRIQDRQNCRLWPKIHQNEVFWSVLTPKSAILQAYMRLKSGDPHQTSTEKAIF